MNASVFSSLLPVFASTLVWRGFNRTAAVFALANIYSDTLVIGIALIGLAYGPEGMVVHEHATISAVDGAGR